MQEKSAEISKGLSINYVVSVKRRLRGGRWSKIVNFETT